MACSEEISQQIPNFTFNINVQHDNIESNKTNGRVCTEKQDLNPVIRHVQNLEQRKHLWSSSKVRKETFPRVKALLNHVPFDPVIDEGSEINCVSEKFVELNKIKFIPTPCSASSADCTKMSVVGQTKEDLSCTTAPSSEI